MMTEEDEAFNEIERQAKQRKEAVRAAMRAIPWVGLTDEEVELYWDWEDFQTGAGRSTIFEMVRDIEAKLKEKNT
jgi:hypothetical protein